MHMLLKLTKSPLLLHLAQGDLVNFHPKQSPKSVSRFIPPFHFLGGMWIATALLPQKKKRFDCSHILFKEVTVNASVQCIPYMISTEDSGGHYLKAVATLSCLKLLSLYCTDLPRTDPPHVLTDHMPKKPNSEERRAVVKLKHHSDLQSWMNVRNFSQDLKGNQKYGM